MEVGARAVEVAAECEASAVGGDKEVATMTPAVKETINSIAIFADFADDKLILK
jgi:hypothetical protein